MEHHLNHAAQRQVCSVMVLPALSHHLQLTLERQQAQQCQGQSRFPRARLAQNTQSFASPDGKADLINGDKSTRFEPTSPARQSGAVTDPQVFHLGHQRGLGLHISQMALGSAVHQFAGVGVLRLLEHLLHRSLFHHMPLFHHRYPIGKALHQIQVVGDHQNRRPGFALQGVEQVQNLTPHGHIQGGGGLIGQQQFGAAGQGHGNHRALALPPR